MLRSTLMFLQQIEDWARAVRTEDFATARMHAQFLAKAGQLLVIEPEFLRRFSEFCPGVDAKLMLEEISRFFECASECKERDRSRRSIAKVDMASRRR